MTDELGSIPATRKAGDENFRRGDERVGVKLLDYWQWAVSDLLVNTERGGIAEFIVALDFGVANGIRNSWEPYDLKTNDGIRVEVKSAAYIQMWKQKRHSQLNFTVRPTYAWNAQNDEFESTQRRQSDAYVFCLLATKDQKTIDPLDIDQWDFYVLSTTVLDERLGDQKTVGLATLLKLGARKSQFGEIATTIREVVKIGSK